MASSTFSEIEAGIYNRRDGIVNAGYGPVTKETPMTGFSGNPFRMPARIKDMSPDN